jgi:hypothetical protein
MERSWYVVNVPVKHSGAAMASLRADQQEQTGREAIAAHQDIHRTASKSDPELDAKFHTALVQMYSLLALSVSRWWITLARARVHELARTMVSRHKSKKYFLPAEERLRRHPFLGRQQAFSITDPWWIM